MCSASAAAGGLKALANHGPVSLEAHSDSLQLRADKDATITSTRERIEVLAKDRITLQVGASTITLDGANLTLACPGNLTVKTGSHQWLGGTSQAAMATLLPSSTTTLPSPKSADTVPPRPLSEVPTVPLVFHIVEESSRLSALLPELYTDAPANLYSFTQSLNPALSDELFPGQLLILGNPNGEPNPEQLTKLQADQKTVEIARQTLDESTQQAIINHYQLLSDLSQSAAEGMGLIATSTGKTLDGLRDVLRDIETLHKNTFDKYGTIETPTFYTQRTALFQKLDTKLVPANHEVHGV